PHRRRWRRAALRRRPGRLSRVAPEPRREGTASPETEARQGEAGLTQASGSPHQAARGADGAAECAEGRDRGAPGRSGSLRRSAQGRSEDAPPRPGLCGQGAREPRGRVAAEAGRARSRGAAMKYAAVLILVLAGWAALKPEPVSWVFVAV